MPDPDLTLTRRHPAVLLVEVFRIPSIRLSIVVSALLMWTLAGQHDALLDLLHIHHQHENQPAQTGHSHGHDAVEVAEHGHGHEHDDHHHHDRLPLTIPDADLDATILPAAQQLLTKSADDGPQLDLATVVEHRDFAPEPTPPWTVNLSGSPPGKAPVLRFLAHCVQSNAPPALS